MDGLESGGWGEGAVSGAGNVMDDGGWWMIEVGSNGLAAGSVVANMSVSDGWGGEGGFAVVVAVDAMYSTSGYPLVLKDDCRLGGVISSFSFLVEVVRKRVASELAGSILIGGILLSMMLGLSDLLPDFPEPDFFFVRASFFPSLANFLLFDL